MDSIKCYQLQCFVLLWLGYCSTYFLRKPLGVVKTVLGEELELGMGELAWLDTALMLPYAAIQVGAPGLTDRFGARRILSGGLICASIATFLSSIAPTFLYLAVTLTFTGLFLAPLWPASSRMLSSWFPDSRLNSVFGLINTATYTGGLGGTALAATVLQYQGWRKVFSYASSFTICVGFLLILLKTPQDRKLEVPGKMDKPVTPGRDSVGKISVMSLIKTVAVKELCITMFCLKFVRFMMYLWLPLYLKKTLGYTNMQAGILSTMFDLGGIFGSPLLGITLDKFYPGVPLKGVTICMFIGTITVGIFILTASGGLGMNCACLIVLGATNCGPDSILAGSVAIEVGNRKAEGNGAGVTSLVNGIGSVGGVVEGPVVWIVWGIAGWAGILPLVLVLTACGTLTCARTYVALDRSNKAESNPHSIA
eukprot:TRINITY_DN12577_c0_g1_i1.p1 TRINITY_DN12577_c0_g1~~TRINITY_DN12577_c0_g1_i1.p1  ORF type:complete len:424 (+),score=63.33 TRINITY_DN12577_c0_g1_i1:653-1924(+)